MKVHAKKVKIAGDVDFEKVARMASGASGAELANIVNEAALRAVRGRAEVRDPGGFGGEHRGGHRRIPEEKRHPHRQGKAYRLLPRDRPRFGGGAADPLGAGAEITIVPRTSGALGYTMQVDEGNHYLMSQEELENKIATLTGGRAAEELVFHSASTGASNDIEQATKLARAMITRYGMSDDFDMVALETMSNQYLGGDASLACSTETQTKIDQQVVELVKGQHQKAIKLLQDNRRKLDEISKYLYEKETITGDEFMALLSAK